VCTCDLSGQWLLSVHEVARLYGSVLTRPSAPAHTTCRIGLYVSKKVCWNTATARPYHSTSPKPGKRRRTAVGLMIFFYHSVVKLLETRPTATCLLIFQATVGMLPMSAACGTSAKDDDSTSIFIPCSASSSRLLLTCSSSRTITSDGAIICARNY